MSQLYAIVAELTEKGVTVKAVDQCIDTGTPEGRAMINMLATFAQFEIEIRKERQAEGIAKAQERGVKFGRKAKATPEVQDQIRQMRADGVLIKDIMAETGLSKASVYRALG